MRLDWSEGEMEASPPCLCLSQDREVTLPCLGQQQAAPAPLGRSSPPRAQGSQDTSLRIQAHPQKTIPPKYLISPNP